jgi:hypothetical protein
MHRSLWRVFLFFFLCGGVDERSLDKPNIWDEVTRIRIKSEKQTWPKAERDRNEEVNETWEKERGRVGGKRRTDQKKREREQSIERLS